jgi:hypothetical protein
LRLHVGGEHRGGGEEGDEGADHCVTGVEGCQSVPCVAIVKAMPQKSTRAESAKNAPW